ncbi:MAG TPA: hypothetical protein VFX51_28570 [Solirubrobacteraceae bacterium]|nr:hypothetical protein [Solirubrobacteraceae bacterium]
MGGSPPKQLTRWEILGAWLRLWTPPRDVVVPPVPWRKVAVGGVLVLAAAAVAVVVLLNTESDRDAAERRAARAAVERHAAFLERVDRRQAPHRGRGPAGADRVSTRRDLLGAAQAEISAVADGRDVDCEPFPRTLDRTPPVEDLARAAAAYDCLAVESRFDTGAIGTPFRLVVHFDRGRFAFCEIVPLGDRDRLSHRLPDACRL